ncbi:hypothetical protein [Sporocytophaga myxococcoides]|uniref:hypothetical protein n=1 Tax=Sporocytophaga myxococcoides TaxID=153721 RepID=UPI00040E7D84|nr:hypothetical protein [Sporocytophaga myxococcoides]
MTNFYFIILVFYFLFSGNIEGYTQSLYKYEFRIFKEGKQVTDKTRNVRVEAGKYNLYSKKYNKLSDTCSDPGKYCFNAFLEFNENLLLKIISKNDSMIIFTSVSMDSLVFKPGEYSYDLSIASYFNIIPSKEISIELVSDLFKLDRITPERRSYTTPSFFTSLRQAVQEFEELKIDPVDTSIFVTSKFNSILFTKDLGVHWNKIEPRFKDKLRNVCFTDDGNKYLIIKRGNHSYRSDFNNYFKNDSLKDLIEDPGWRNIVCPENDALNKFAFKLKDKNVDDEYLTDEYSEYDCDSCPLTYRYNRRPVFQIIRNVKFWNSGSQKMDYINPEYPKLYEFNHKKILLFNYYFMYSEDDKYWKYYSFSDFYFYRPFDYERWIRFFNESEFYWLEGKGLLFRYRDVGLFLINVLH